MFRLHILGEVLLDAGQVRVNRRMVRGLLVALAFNANTAVSGDRLTEMLWDSPPKSAMANLRSHAAELRKQLAGTTFAQSLQHVTAGYRLDVDPADCDATVFASLACNGHRHLQRGDLTGAAARLREALRVWREPSYATLPSSSWMISEFEQRHDVMMQARDDLHVARLLLHDTEGLLPELRRNAALFSHHERTWGRLMQVSYLSGDQVSALAAFQRATTTLSDSYGLDASPELHRLHLAILNHDEEAIAGYGVPVVTAGAG
ncbi:AfsR/SARP family transcriptional regulator [Actinoplanes sp. NPDC051861]|uniref:AfsR/SARP family transcriptional regulator n=1 Tax=Actinoplanes sp. NPDC051861 TaxID=3155170 RepID=UPI003445FC8C